MLDTVEYLLPIMDQAGAHPFRQRSQALGETRGIIENEESLNARPFHKEVAFHPRTDRRWVPTRDRRGAADHYARDLSLT